MDPLARLLVRYRERGDVEALGQVFDQTAPRLLQLAVHLCRSLPDAEDLLQATFVRAMLKANDFDASQPLLPWLCGILAGEAQNLARRNLHRQTEPLPELTDPEHGPMTAAERSEQLAALRAHVQSLPQEQRQVLLLQLQHGLSPTAIAEVLEVPPGTVRMRLHRGIAALRKLLPAGLAAWLFGALPTRGLAAVRQAVIQFGKGAAVGSGAVAVAAGGVVVTKWIALGVAVLVLACLWAWSDGVAPVPPAPDRAGSALAPPVASHETPAAGSVRSEAPTSVDRVAIAAAGSLLVTVRSATSQRPLADVAVWAWPGPRPVPPVDDSVALARTAADGTVLFAALAPGPWRVQPACGFTGTAVAVTIAASVAVQCQLALPTEPLQGRVVDELGAPVAGASIRLSCLSGISFARTAIAENEGSSALRMRTAARSASDGSFVCDCGDQEDKIGAEHPQYGASCAQLTAAAQYVGVDSWQLVLPRRQCSLQVSVRGVGGEPIAGALVAAMSARPWVHRQADGTWLSVPLPILGRTDAAGAVGIDALLPGPVHVWVRAEDRRIGEAFVELSSEVPSAVQLQLGSAVKLVGRVRRADGSPVGNIGVAATNAMEALGVLAMTRTSADGAFALANLPVTPFWIRVGDEAGPPLLLQRVAPLAPGPMRQELLLPALPSLRGRVVAAAGAPLPHWWVRGVDADGKAGEVWATADAEGWFVLRDLRAQRLHLSTSWPQGDSRRPAAELADVSVFAGEVELRVAAAQLPSGSVVGRLVDAAGLGIGGAVVSLRVQEPQRCTATSASDGSFRITAVPPGDYDLLVTTAPAPPRRLLHLQLDAQQALALGSVHLLPTATLRLCLLRADGTPWRGLLVYPDLLGPKGERCEWTLRAIDGELQGPVEPGPLRIEFHDPDILAEPLDLELLPGERRRVTVRLAIGRSRELVFAGDGKTPIDSLDALHLEVLDGNGAVVLHDAVRRSPHGDGNWTFERTFAFGSYRVTARTDSGRRFAGAFQVREDLGDASQVEVGLLKD